MKRFRIEIPGESKIPKEILGKGMPQKIILTGSIFMFWGGGMKSYTIIDKNFLECMPTCLLGLEIKKSNSLNIHSSFEYPYGVINFFSYDWWLLQRSLNGDGLSNGEKKWNDYVRRSIKIAHIIINDGEFKKGSEEKLREYGIKLIS